MSKTAFVRCEAFNRTDKNGKMRSLVSAAAYISGTKMRDDLLKKTYDYSRKSEVIFSKIFWPNKDEKEFFKDDPEKFFNALQASDRKKDGSLKTNVRLAKKYVLAVPNELSKEAATELMEKMSKEFAMDFFVSYGALHWSPQNHHIHFLVADKVFENGHFKKKNSSKRGYTIKNGEKVPLIDPKTGLQKTRIRIKNGKEYTEKLWKREKTDRWSDSKDFLNHFKRQFEYEANRLLEKEGCKTRISTQMEAGMEPEIHVGAAAWDRRKKGLYSSRWEQNERIKVRNAARRRKKAEKPPIAKPKPAYKPYKLSEAESVGLEILRSMAKGLSSREILNSFGAKLATGGERANDRLMMAVKQINTGKVCLPVPAEFMSADKKSLDVTKIRANPEKFAKNMAALAAKQDSETIGGMAAALVPIPGIKSIVQKAVAEVAEGVLKTSYSRQGSAPGQGQGELRGIKDVITGQKDSHTQLVARATKNEPDEWFWLNDLAKDDKREEMARKRTY